MNRRKKKESKKPPADIEEVIFFVSVLADLRLIYVSVYRNEEGLKP